jgi:hypothetical protein
LIVLLGFWAVGLIFGFALLQYGTGQHISVGNQPLTFRLLIYHSGETFFTLGYGDITPTSTIARFLAVLEAGMGFAFLGVVIGYLPVVYTAFSDLELEVSMLDSRAGSPPSAMEMLNRLGCCPDQTVLDEIFRDWEKWSAKLLASHLSYPVLSFFRSQHSNQSWLGALTTMLDVTSLVIAGVDGIRPEQARLTFAMARHAAVDLAQVVNARFNPNEEERLPANELELMRQQLASNGLRLHDDDGASQKLQKMRLMYEPYVQAIARNLLVILPPWIRTEKKKDNWQSGPWDRAIQARALAALGKHPTGQAAPYGDDHF